MFLTWAVVVVSHMLIMAGLRIPTPLLRRDYNVK